jgi:hypothetical protein
MNEELGGREGGRKEGRMKPSWPNLRYHLRISLEILRKTTKDLSQESWSLT